MPSNLYLSRFEISQIALIAFGFVLLLIGNGLEVVWLMNLGLLLLGAGTLLSSVDALILNRIGFWSQISQELFGSGRRSILGGILFCLAGIWITIFALVRLLGFEQQAVAYLGSHPAVVLLNVALLMFLLAAMAFLRLEGWSASFQNVLRALPIVIVGVILLLLAISLLAFGLYTLFDPSAANSWLHRSFAPISSFLADRL